MAKNVISDDFINFKHTTKEEFGAKDKGLEEAKWTTGFSIGATGFSIDPNLYFKEFEEEHYDPSDRMPMFPTELEAMSKYNKKVQSAPKSMQSPLPFIDAESIPDPSENESFKKGQVRGQGHPTDRQLQLQEDVKKYAFATSGELLADAQVVYPTNAKIKSKLGRTSIAGCSMRASKEGLKTSTTPSEVEDLDWLKESLGVFISQEPIIIYAISIDKEQKENNQTNSIRCYGGIALGGYAHDQTKDSYLVQCVEYLQLGNLSFSFVITIPSAGNWKAKMPAPEKVIEKHFSPEQRKQLEMYREKYKSPRYDVQFIQMLGCDF
jgi:hypothetical protein